MAALQAPLSLGFSRQEYWRGLHFPSSMHESEKWKWSRGAYNFGPLLWPYLHEMFPWYLWFSWKDLYPFPFYCLPSISLHWSLRKAFLSRLAILWNSAFKWVYLSFSPLPFTSLLFSAICKASSDNHFACLHFFFLGMVLITATHTMSQTSVHSSTALYQS